MKRPVAAAVATLLLFFCRLSASEGGEDSTWRPEAYKPLFTEAERAAPYVFGESFTFSDHPFLDGQWEGILAADDGNVYFAVSSHAKRRHAQVFRYLPAEKTVQHLADLGHACGEMPVVTAPQDKIHSRMFEEDGVIYAGTCDGHSYQDLPYAGGHWIAIDTPTGKVRSLGKSVSDDGLICVGYDRRNKLLYGHTNHEGRLMVFDPATGEERDLGFPWKGSRAEWPRGLSLMITEDGRVYGGRPPACSFWEYDPDSGTIRTLDVRPPPPETLDPEDAKAMRKYRESSIHMTLWNEQDRCFYFVRSFDEMLGRFHPPDGDAPARVEMIRRLRPADLPVRYDLRPAACVLVIHDRTVYYTPHTGWGGVTHLVGYHLDRKGFTDHGPVIVEGGRRVAEVHSMDAGADGALYMVGFVYSVENAEPVRPYALRDGYPFHPRLVIVDPRKDFKAGTGAAAKGE